MKKETFIVSLGGSIIVPDQIDVDFIKAFRTLIINQTKKNRRFIIVTGGGKVCRRYQGAGAEVRKMSAEEKDWIGIYVTQMNSHFMRILFGDYASEKTVFNIHKKVAFDKPIMFGAGWEPGTSTDYDAVILAKQYGAKTILNLSNIDKVYTKDPNKYKSAKPIDQISWPDFRKIVGNTFTPGGNYPFDPIASKEAESLGLRVVSMNGRNIDNLKSFFAGKEYIGTEIC